MTEPKARAATALKEAEAALLATERRYRSIFDGAPDAVFLLAAGPADGGRILDANTQAATSHGYAHEELLKLTILDLNAPHAASLAADRIRRILGGENLVFESLHRRKDGSEFPVEVTARLVEVDGAKRILAFNRDITERKAAEAERDILQGQLQQALKMESIGQLAGGVAHNFNNLLTAIIMNAGLAMGMLPPDSPVSDHLLQIEECARRSAELTSQLLAFARKQTIAPKVVDLNATVQKMLKILRRLIGEDIDLVWTPGKALWPIKVDPGQIDQVLANLCVNARDAISGVGQVKIETANIVFDPAQGPPRPGAVPGEYVMLAVSDNGCGMTEEVLNHVFEPFFTTKEVGQGTGLGLATVYGIVQQNAGFIDPTSEPGRGTTFRIYLRRHVAAAENANPAPPARARARGSGAILLVEDEPSIRLAGRRMLEELGYTVLAAGLPSEAMRLAAEHPGGIHLLLTDVIMPEMNGRDLAKRLLLLHPGMKCLFMSGYDANVLAPHGVLEPGVRFIAKPFSPQDLEESVRSALGGN